MAEKELSKNEVLDTLKHKYTGKRQYNSFIPGFILGVIMAKQIKNALAEPAFASNYKLIYIGPWFTLLNGLVFGSLMHYWNWKRRMMLEHMCYAEDEMEERVLEDYLG